MIWAIKIIIYHTLERLPPSYLPGLPSPTPSLQPSIVSTLRPPLPVWPYFYPPYPFTATTTWRPTLQQRIGMRFFRFIHSKSVMYSMLESSQRFQTLLDYFCISWESNTNGEPEKPLMKAAAPTYRHTSPPPSFWQFV